MKKYNNLLIVLLFVLFSSCQYELSEDFYNDKIRLEDPNVSLNLSDLTDGAVFRESKTIDFDYSASDKNSLYEIQFYVDDNFLDSSEFNSGSVLLDVENIDEGDHVFRVEYYFKTSSGSLAEISGAESYFIIEEFNFSVIKSIPLVEIDRVENKEGTLYVYFKDYEQIEEIGQSINVSLEVNTNSYAFENFFGFSETIELTKEDLLLGYYVDKESTGLLTKYKIITSNDFNSFEDEIEINLLEKFEYSVTPIDFESLKIEWGDHPLYNNVVAMSYHTDVYDDRSRVYLSDGKSGELIVETDVSFGSDKDYLIDFGEYIRDSYSYGEKVKDISFGELKYNPKTNKIYALEIRENENDFFDSKVYLHILNSDNLNVEQSKFIDNTIGDFGEVKLSKDSKIIIDLSRKSLLVDDISLNILRTFNGEDYHNDIVNFTEVSFRDDIIIINNSSNGFDSSIDIYDLNTKELLLRSKANYAFSSQNSKYIAMENKIYKKSELTGRYEIFYEFSFDCCDIDNMIYVEEENVFYVTINTSFGSGGITYSLNETTKEETRLSVPVVRYIDYDFLTNKLLLKDRFSSSIRSYNIKTGQVNIFENSNSSRFFLINNFLISFQGYYFKDIL